jgi:hypothetical protein
MIDASAPAASWFLWILGSTFLVVYALPLFVAPFAWARVFLWKVDRRDPLTLYFGRCVGAVAVAICVITLRAAPDAGSNPTLFEFIGVSGALLAVVHLVGAIEGEQPWTETAEILLFGGAAAYALWLRSGM